MTEPLYYADSSLTDWMKDRIQDEIVSAAYDLSHHVLKGSAREAKRLAKKVQFLNDLMSRLNDEEALSPDEMEYLARDHEMVWGRMNGWTTSQG